MTNPSIRIRAVNKHFGRTHAVRDLDLEVPEGSLCGFLGPNGAGKSTTIRMIMSIIYPDSGTIDVLGGSALRSKDRIGYLPEERGVYRKMKVVEFLEYIARLKGVARRGLSDRIDEWLTRIELPDVHRKKCEELSKGMQQKVQFLAAIIHDPDLLIFDEPFSGLDPVNTELLRRLIDELHRSGKTIIFSTHILHQAERICDRIFLINHGIKLLDATLRDVRDRFDPRTILATPLANSIDLDGVAGVASARPLPESTTVEIEVEDGADPQEVMRTILAAVPLRRIELRQLSLDEVFVRLVSRQEGHDAAAEAKEQLSHV